MKEYLPEHTSVVQKELFEMPVVFVRVPQATIKMAKEKKVSRRDKINVQMLQVVSQLFKTPSMSLWTSVARLNNVLNILRSGLLVLVHKKRDFMNPGNYLSIKLLLVFCRIITKALRAEFRVLYKFHLAQWGFLRGTKAEVFSLAATDMIRSAKNKLAVLDLVKPMIRSRVPNV